MKLLKTFVRKIDVLSCSVPAIRAFYLLRASAFYLFPSVRRRINDNFTQVRSTEKMDPAYDLSLYEFFKKYIQLYCPQKPVVMADLGSGDGVIHAVQFILHDAVSRFYLVDEFLFPKIIHAKIDSYIELVRDKECVQNALSFVKTSNGSLKDIPEGSVDVVISTSLFEHVLRRDVSKLVAEIHIILKAKGIAIISIDLRDHYDFSRPFFFYRHPEWLWKLMTYDRGRYMNRLRTPEFVQIFKECGFTILHTEEEKSDAPLPKKINAHFRQYSEDDLHSIRLIAILQK